MTTFLPNIDDLLAALPDTKAAVDARELAIAGATAETSTELDQALSAIVQEWLS
ncbi:hypothetical protein ACFSWE_07870 [Leucobacter albus]|uniref:Uncharacterized protein n=1 Tax=Leucobacter albus TaxID=272210 RepID=A0ABW3TJM7_9MICO